MQRTGVLVTAIIRHVNVFAKFCIYLCSGGKTSIKNERANICKYFDYCRSGKDFHTY